MYMPVKFQCMYLPRRSLGIHHFENQTKHLKSLVATDESIFLVHISQQTTRQHDGGHCFHWLEPQRLWPVTLHMSPYPSDLPT